MNKKTIMHTSLAKISTLFVMAVLLFLSACSLMGEAPGEDVPTPVPTSIIPGLHVVEPKSCLVAEQEVIRVEQPQGDLVAWSPVENMLAYVASTRSSTWNVGDLNIIAPPAFDSPIRLASQVAGELAWSPEGLNLAYLSLRRSDNLYTIVLVNPNGRGSRDLFPQEAARTDAYASQKAILEWLDEGRLRVLTSCGVDCMHRMDIGILTGLSTPGGEEVDRSWELWSVHFYQPIQVPPEFKNLTGQLNWSPDNAMIAYMDENGSAWLVDIEAGRIHPLDIGEFGTAYETDWSFDSQYLAVRVDQWLKIFAFNCP